MDAKKILDDFWWPNDTVKQEVELYTKPAYDDDGTPIHEWNHIFFFGPPGTGKTLLTKLLPRAMYESWGGTSYESYRKALVRNFSAFTSEDRSKQIDMCRKHFAVNMGIFASDALVGIGIIDEMDDMVPSQKALLKNILDKFEKLDNPVVLFCTANTADFPKAVQNRMHTINVPPPTKEVMLAQGQKVLAAEGAKLSEDDLMKLVDRSGGSVRAYIKDIGRAVMRHKQRKGRPAVALATGTDG